MCMDLWQWGGVNPNDSDILVVTDKTMKVEMKRTLAQLFLDYSNSPFPIEISFLNKGQLKDWQHPCLFDFHYSEFWRERYRDDLVRGTFKYLNRDSNTDIDLAAHITMMNHRGLCLGGDPIAKVFPIIPQSDYISSIIDDFKSCLHNIEEDPVYCSLNLIRVYWYLKEGMISSKLEAGNWALRILPSESRMTVKKVIGIYTGRKENSAFDKDELSLFRNYIAEEVEILLQTDT